MSDQEEIKPHINVIQAPIVDEMKKSYVTYAMSVIVSRALPDVRDGLKPVHRRVLYGMENLSLNPGKPYKKSARIVGDVIGKYHPHGDTAVYHTLVRMAQDFSMRYRLVQGQGNFGSIDGDSPAAMRYTEARMDPFSALMLEDLEKETVDFVPNYDDSLTEPSVLPSAFPNLLVNGTTGIAVGMATNLAPHNLTEITNAIIAVIRNPEMPDEELLKIVSGPDFPTGGIIYGRMGIQLAYLKGKGRVQLRGKIESEEMPNGKHRMIVTEIPFQVNKSMLLEKMAQLIRTKTIEGISDLRDESDRHGMRIVIELKKDGIPEIILNKLFKYTQLQVTYSINNLALVDGKPKVLTLRQLIDEYIKHRHVIVVRRTEYEKRKAEERAHILEGLRIAIENIDNVIAIIRNSADTAEAQRKLEETYQLSEKQSQAIVEMRLRTLTGLEIEKIEKEYKELVEKIKDYIDILSNLERRMNIVADELSAIEKKHGDPRRTAIEDVAEEVTHLDLIADEPMVITISHQGYIKRIPADSYRAQGRGGRGITAATFKTEDFIEHLFVGWAHSYVLIFTNLGRCYWLRVFEIPEGSRTSKGKALVNLAQLSQDEKVTAFVPVKSFDSDQFLVLATQKGIINKMSLADFSRRRASGINAINLDDNDKLINVVLATNSQDVMIGTRLGQAIRFEMSQFRQTGRGTRGVKGISLSEEDSVIGMVVIDGSQLILTVTEKGFAKCTNPSEYRLTGRGGKGVKNMKITDKNGPVVAICAVDNKQELMILTINGVLIKLRVDSISVLGRATQGVRAIRVGSGDAVTDVEVMDSDENLEEEAKALSAESARVELTDSHSEDIVGEDILSEDDDDIDEIESQDGENPSEME